MKFLRLGLDRYGPFTDRALCFSPTAKVSVVLGANEAGKSTALAAACDALFGIEERTRFNFLHDYKSMRLSATVADSAGQPLSFARLKRRQATLVDPDTGAPLADDALAALLGAHDRDAFLEIFGLNQKRLREGGAKLLAGGGDLAEALITAAPGLSRVAALRDRMKADAATLFNPDRKNSHAPFYLALERYKVAQAEIQAAELRGDEVRTLREAADEAAERRRAAVEAEIDAGLAETRAQNLIRAAKDLRTLAAAEAGLAALGSLPPVEPGFAETARARRDAHAHAVEAAAVAAEALALAQARRAAITPDAAVLAVADQIVHCDGERATVEHERASLPNRHREADEARAGLAHIAGNLGLADVADLRSRRPDRPLLARAGDLLDQLGALAGRLEALEQEEENLARRRRASEGQSPAAAPVDDPAPLRRRIDALDGAEARAEALRTLAMRLKAADEALATRIARLPFGPWRAEALAPLPLPDRAAAETALRGVATSAEQLARAREQLADLDAQHAQLTARRAALDATGTAPTPQAIAAARTGRDGVWHHLRPALLGQRPPEPADAERTSDFEQALAAADRLADERLTETQRLADLGRAELDLADVGARRATAAGRIAAAAAEAEAAQARWLRLWTDSGLAPPADATALAFLQSVDALRDMADDRARQQAEATQAADGCERDRQQAEALHSALGLPALGSGPVRLDPLRAAIAACEEAFRRQREQLRDRERIEEQAAHLAERRAALDAKAATLAGETAALFPVLAIRTGASLAEARAALNLWQEALTLDEKLATAERRIAGIEQDERRFSLNVEAVLQQLGDVAEGDLLATVRALRSRLEAAGQARAQAQAADATLAEHSAAAEAATAALARAEAALEGVLAQAGVAEGAALPEQLARLERAAALRAEREAVTARLDDLRGDRSLEEIRAAIAGRDDETLARDAAAASEAQGAARIARDAAIERDTQARAALQALDTRAGAAAAAQEAQDAATEIEATMERFVHAHAVARLLTHAVDRYRQAHQSPIVTAAAAAFRTLTSGRWEGIAIDYDAEPPRLAAVRDGQPHGVEALSEGTGDQLFLALRVAAIAEHARRATPLPFLADDLFITFDEERTEAGLRLLAELGATTQVIVFTHHAYVAECATRALGGDAEVIRL